MQAGLEGGTTLAPSAAEYELGLAAYVDGAAVSEQLKARGAVCIRHPGAGESSVCVRGGVGVTDQQHRMTFSETGSEIDGQRFVSVPSSGGEDASSANPASASDAATFWAAQQVQQTWFECFEASSSSSSSAVVSAVTETSQSYLDRRHEPSPGTILHRGVLHGMRARRALSLSHLYLWY